MNQYQVVLSDESETFTTILETDSVYLVDDYDSGKLKDEDILEMCDFESGYKIRDIIPC